MTCARLDATVVPTHSGKDLAEANFKGYGHHPAARSHPSGVVMEQLNRLI